MAGVGVSITHDLATFIGRQLFRATWIPKQIGVLGNRPVGQRRDALVKIALRYVPNGHRYRVLNALFLIC